MWSLSTHGLTLNVIDNSFIKESFLYLSIHVFPVTYVYNTFFSSFKPLLTPFSPPIPRVHKYATHPIFPIKWVNLLVITYSVPC